MIKKAVAPVEGSVVHDMVQYDAFFENVVIDSVTKQNVKWLMCRVSAEVANSRCLSNVLIVGPAGCGKSLISKCIAESASIDYAVICGSDLQTLGVKAGLILQNIFATFVRRKTRSIIIIDDADSIIVDRESESSPARSCLYSLLEILRVNFPYYCVYLSTQLTVDQIDKAILDRMDHLVTMSTPHILQRLDFNIREFKTTLLKFMKPKDQLKFDLVLSPTGSLSDIYSNHIRNYHNRALVERSGQVSSYSPETDIPLRSQQNLQATTQSSLRAYLSDTKALLALDDFDLQLCLQLLTELSEGWSFRELAKFFSNVRSSVLGTERCEPSTSLWIKELQHMCKQPRLCRSDK